MAGLLGSIVAGAAGGYANARMDEVNRQQDFDMRRALLDAQMDKELRLKEAGIALEDQHAESQRQRMQGVMGEIEKEYDSKQENEPGGYDPKNPNGPKKFSDLTPAEQAMERGQGLLSRGYTDTAKDQISISAALGKKEKSFDAIKLDDGSVMSVDKSTGEGKIILEGGGQMNVPKNEFELAWRMADGDPKKAGEILVQQKARVAAAGRSPGAEGQPPADVKSAQWLIDNGVAKDPKDAWNLVKMTKAASPQEAIADIAKGLMKEFKYQDKPELAVQDAKKIFQAINSDSSEEQPAANPKPWQRKY